MVRVRLVGGSHAKDGRRWTRGDVLEVSQEDFESFKFKFERLPDEEAEPEPLIETEETASAADEVEEIAAEEDGAEEASLEDAWYGAHATTAARRMALENDLRPEDVEGTGKDGRIIKGDVRRALG